MSASDQLQLRVPRTWASIALLIVAAVGVLALLPPPTARTREGTLTFLFLATVAAVLLIAPLRRTAHRAVTRLDRLGQRGQLAIAGVIFLAMVVYLPVTASRQGRDLAPQIHDSLSYAVMARVFASGHLWMPPHPLADSLGSFYLFVQPVYGSMYFPGAGLFYAVPLLLGLPLWTASAGLSAYCLAMLFRVTARLLSPAFGLATVAMTLGTVHFRWLSLQVLSHLPLFALVLTTYWCYLRWQGKHGRRWIIGCGVLAGIAAITRPIDAALLLLPVGVAILRQAAAMNRRHALVTLALGAVPVLPFLVLQLVLNDRFTGDWRQTPFAAYFEREMPNAGFGFEPYRAEIGPQSKLPQMEAFYRSFVRGFMQSHAPPWKLLTRAFWQLRLDTMMFGTSELRIALIPVLLGLAALVRSHRWPIAIGPFVLFAGYLPYPFYLTWYPVAGLAGFWLCVWGGVIAMDRLVPSSRRRLQSAILTGVAAVGVASLPEWWGPRLDRVIFESPELTAINRVIRDNVKTPAIVFFRYPRGDADFRAQHEPVYNLDTAWPDDADVIRLHAVDPRTDREALEYYRRQSPQRHVYLLDRAKGVLEYQGSVSDLLDGPTPDVSKPRNPTQEQ